jgi:hypothetical protein
VALGALSPLIEYVAELEEPHSDSEPGPDMKRFAHKYEQLLDGTVFVVTF